MEKYTPSSSTITATHLLSFLVPKDNCINK
jgi:hypothetical protein